MIVGYLVTLITALSSAATAITVMRLLADFLMWYPVPKVVVAPEGSTGIDTKYFSLLVNASKSISAPQVAEAVPVPVKQISAWVVVIRLGRRPLLSIVN